ncbi:MAG: cysteine peptidase family C39 domain-containing protein, partial [Burkholderiales bacterium]
MPSQPEPPSGNDPPGSGRTGPQDGPDRDPGLSCLAMLARLHSIAADPSQLAHKFRASNERTGVGELVLAGRSLGLRVKAGRFDPARLAT